MFDIVAGGHTEWYQTAPTPTAKKRDHNAQDPSKHARLDFNFGVAFLATFVAGDLGSLHRPVVLVIRLFQFCMLRLLMRIDENGRAYHGHLDTRLLWLHLSGTCCTAGRHSRRRRCLHLARCHHAWLCLAAAGSHHGWLAVRVLGLHHHRRLALHHHRRLPLHHHHVLTLGDLLTVDKFGIGTFFHSNINL